MSARTPPPPPPEIRVEMITRGERVILCLAGELSLESVPSVEERLESALGRSEGELVIDLREVSFLDSSGVRLLLTAEKQSEEVGRDFAIVVEDGQPVRALEVMGLVDQPRRLNPVELA